MGDPLDDAKQDADANFGSGPAGGAAEPCAPIPNQPGAGKPAPAAPAWTVDGLTKSVKACDGGTGIWDKAKTAGGKEPTLTRGPEPTGFGASTDTPNNAVTIDPAKFPDKCLAAQVLVFELTNAANAPNFAKVHKEAVDGNLSREEYTRANEKLEYEAVENGIKAFDACKKAWGCDPSSRSFWEAFRPAKDFNDYYTNYRRDPDAHKDYYRKAWDSRFKTAYEAKHPPAPAPPPQKKKDGCFIATAAYGSPIADNVQFLRELRDNVLRQTGWGARFFDDYWAYYYQFSPEIAARMNADPRMTEIVRWSIVTPMVNYLKLLVARPRHWDLSQVDPELREYLETMKQNMDDWLGQVALPETFAGLDNHAIIGELNIALDIVLREEAKVDAYLDRLVTNGALPLTYSPEEHAALRAGLLAAGRSISEVQRILYGKSGGRPSGEQPPLPNGPDA